MGAPELNGGVSQRSAESCSIASRSDFLLTRSVPCCRYGFCLARHPTLFNIIACGVERVQPYVACVRMRFTPFICHLELAGFWTRLFRNLFDKGYLAKIYGRQFLRNSRQRLFPIYWPNESPPFHFAYLKCSPPLNFYVR